MNPRVSRMLSLRIWQGLAIIERLGPRIFLETQLRLAGWDARLLFGQIGGHCAKHSRNDGHKGVFGGQRCFGKWVELLILISTCDLALDFEFFRWNYSRGLLRYIDLDFAGELFHHLDFWTDIPVFGALKSFLGFGFREIIGLIILSPRSYTSERLIVSAIIR